MLYEVSKAVQNGQLVSLRGNKFIVCGKGTKPRGVYISGTERRILHLDGYEIRYIIPQGIVVEGQTSVLAGPNDA